MLQKLKRLLKRKTSTSSTGNPNRKQKLNDLPLFTHLIVGLGNPGPRYVRTRHNVGFMLVEMLAQEWGAAPVPVVSNARVGGVTMDGVCVGLMQPQTYMNRSGDALQSLLAQNDMPLEQVLVVYDDVSLPLGRMRLRRDGSAGGHKGLGHIVETLATTRVPRLRVGIGGNVPQSNLVDFVLGEFDERESVLLEKVLENAAKAARMWLFEPMDTVMSKVNGSAVTAD